MLIHDYRIVRSGLKLLINRTSDLKVIAAVSQSKHKDQVVKTALQKKPDIVIISMTPPVRETLKIMKQIKQKANNIKIIVLSAYEYPDYIFRAIHAGASGYLLESHHENDLIQAIRTVYEGGFYLYPKAAKVLLENYRRRLKEIEEERNERLTVREQEVLTYLALGYTNREIAEEKMYLSVKTIEVYRANIMRKLRLNSRVDLVSYAIEKGYLIFPSQSEHI